MTVPCSRRPSMTAACSLVLLAALLLPAAAAAAPADANAATATEGGGLDPTEARRLRFLFWAYTAIWILLAAYLLSLSLRLRAIQLELRRTTERLERGAGTDARRNP